MKNKHIVFKYDCIEPIAKEIFIRECGFQLSNTNHCELFKEGLLALGEYEDNLVLSAVLCDLNKNAFNANTLSIKNKKFNCPAFRQIQKENIIKIYAYILAIREDKPLKSNVGNNKIEEYYINIWSDAFLESGKRLLYEQISQTESCLYSSFYISNSFEPGSYGMTLDKLMDLFEVLGGEQIGVLKDENNKEMCKCSGGFFFVMKKDIGLDVNDCQLNAKTNIAPDKKACLKLLKEYKTPPHVVRHCKAVTRVALQIAKALNQKGQDIDLKLLEAAALLHDIARIEKNHGLKGAMIVKKYGYKRLSNLIRCHMFYATDPTKERINEQDILCLADRMVKEDQYVGIDVRMQSVLDKFKSKPLIGDRIRKRLKEYQLLQKRIEEIIGITIDELIRET